MKKIIIFLFVITITISVFSTNNEIIIPTNSIRLRLIANSNDSKDQIIKYNLKEELSSIIANIENTSNDIDESREAIINSIPLIEDKLNEFEIKYDINYGNNLFPEKNYKGVSYEAGNYESLVITIGEGLGENWWCVLFPPLCLVDEENIEEKEYSLYVTNILRKFK